MAERFSDDPKVGIGIVLDGDSTDQAEMIVKLKDQATETPLVYMAAGQHAAMVLIMMMCGDYRWFVLGQKTLLGWLG